MTDQLESATDTPSSSTPQRGRHRVLLSMIVFAMVAVGFMVIRQWEGSGRGVVPRTPSRPAGVVGGDPARASVIRALLRQRSAAIVDHDRARFMATLDPAATGFRRREAAMFGNLARVRFASWSYSLGSRAARLPAGLAHRDGGQTWAPATFALHYRLAGFDRRPTDLVQYPTFVDRGGRWYLASLSDFRSRGEVSATDLWDYTSVRVVRRPSVLVLGSVGQRRTMVEVAKQVKAAIPRVSEVWGRDWARQAVVLVPSTQSEMGRIDDYRGSLDHVAALTSAEISAAPGRPAPVGDRITINPRNWPKLSRTGAAVVVRHELTHVASRADTAAATPRWLSEGFADYIGFRGSGLPVAQAAAELSKAVHAGQPPRRLPGARAFRSTAAVVARAYETSWLACRAIAARFGPTALVRFYRAVGTSRHSGSAALTVALHQVLGLGPWQFTRLWRGEVRRELLS